MNILDLSYNTCRYPIGDPKQPGFGYCGKECAGTYCKAHRDMCFTNGKHYKDLTTNQGD